MTYTNLYINGILSDITVENGIITNIADASTHDTNRAVALPTMANMHTHSAMTLLRSAGSGLPLFRWLNETILPAEKKLSPEDIYRGSKDACEEMLHTGTSAFNDMYFCIDKTILAAHQASMEGNISLSVTDADFDDSDKIVAQYMSAVETIQKLDNPYISTSISPHAIYTVSGKNLIYLADFAHEHNTLFHIHISETQKEREDCIRQHGVPPVIYLEKLGVLDKVGDRFIGAHALWLDPDEIKVLGDHNATVVHCPNSNLKLGSGYHFLYTELRDAGVNVTLGTDGCASSDNLDMIEAMKIMSLLQKGSRYDPSVLPAAEVFDIATKNGRKALHLPDNSIAVGNIAKFFTVDLDQRVFKGIDLDNSAPNELHSAFLNRLIYAANGEYITKTIC
ncbi:MAG: amidohydrolase family protein [Bacteroidales bacterium]|nr:amidohydrolase family protein [Bacteroidales bacterium]